MTVFILDLKSLIFHQQVSAEIFRTKKKDPLPFRNTKLFGGLFHYLWHQFSFVGLQYSLCSQFRIQNVEQGKRTEHVFH